MCNINPCQVIFQFPNITIGSPSEQNLQIMNMSPSQDFPRLWTSRAYILERLCHPPALGFLGHNSPWFSERKPYDTPLLLHLNLDPVCKWHIIYQVCSMCGVICSLTPRNNSCKDRIWSWVTQKSTKSNEIVKKKKKLYYIPQSWSVIEQGLP